MDKELALKYFKAFSNKDLATLETMFSENVVLRDWLISVNGRLSVLEANKNIFNSVTKILVVPQTIFVLNNTVIAELEIMVNHDEKIYVIDVIEYDSQGKIQSIRAYKG
jgi:hypothetical protein